MASSRRPPRGRRLPDDFALHASALATQTTAAVEGGIRRATLQPRRKGGPSHFRDNDRAFYFSVSQWHDRFATTDTKRREMRAYRRSDITRGKMRVVLFGHSRIRVAKLFGDNPHGHAPHGEGGTMRVPKDMK